MSQFGISIRLGDGFSCRKFMENPELIQTPHVHFQTTDLQSWEARPTASPLCRSRENYRCLYNQRGTMLRGQLTEARIERECKVLRLNPSIAATRKREHFKRANVVIKDIQKQWNHTLEPPRKKPSKRSKLRSSSSGQKPGDAGIKRGKKPGPDQVLG